MAGSQTFKCRILQTFFTCGNRPILVLDAVVTSLVEFAVSGSGVVVFWRVFRWVEGSFPVEGENVGQLKVLKVDDGVGFAVVWFSPSK